MNYGRPESRNQSSPTIFAQEAAIKRPNTVEEIAALALLLASKEIAGTTGAMFSVDGGTAQF